MLFIDTETDGLSNDRKLRLIQTCEDGGEIKLHHPTDEVLDYIRNYEGTFIAHNAAFDLISLGLAIFDTHEEIYDWMQRLAIEGRIIDTMVAYQVIHSKPRVSKMSNIAAEVGVDNKPEEAFEAEAERLGFTASSKYAKIPADNEVWLAYARHDIMQLQAAYSLVEDYVDHPLVKSETVAEILYAILKHRGMAVDVDRGDEVLEEMSWHQQAAVTFMQEFGVEKANSVKQVRQALAATGWQPTKMTPKGSVSVDKSVLSDIKTPPEAVDIAEAVLEVRSVTKDIASVKNIASHCVDGRVHPQLWRIGAVTGRSSCSAPNLQQLNKHAGDSRVRSILCADEGQRLASVDFDGMELAVCAYLTKDEAMRDHIATGADIHGEIAAIAFGADYTTQQRHQAKGAVFALLYGGGDNTIANHVGLEPEQASNIRQAWETKYPTAAIKMSRWKAEANATGHVFLDCGWCPEVGRADDGGFLGYKAVNYQIQGTAAFIFRQAAAQLAEAGLWKYVRMVVHDEFVVSLPMFRARNTLEEIRSTAEVHTDFMTFTTGSELYHKHWGTVVR